MSMATLMKRLVCGRLLRAGLVLALLGPAGRSGAETISCSDYRHQLTVLDDHLAAASYPAALLTARHLATCRIHFQDELVDPDPGLLTAVEKGSYHQARHRIGVILAQLARPLGASAAPAAPRDVDAAALAGIAAAQGQLKAPADGDLGDLPLQRLEVSDSTMDWISSCLHWAGRTLRGWWHWLKSWFLGDDEHGKDGARGHMTVIVIIAAVVIMIGFTVLALLNRRAPATIAARPASGDEVARDADPRSRASAEWRRYGDRLAAEGRWREAVRAWYHAVLVQCWTSGTIRHRVGWTNWEYAAHLPPSWPQRSAFVDLTARFDRAWYGNLGGREEAETFSQLSHQLAEALVGR